MKPRRLYGVIAASVMITLLSFGCAPQSQQTTTAAKPAVQQAQKKAANVYKGPIVGKSNKAKTISITVGKGDTAQTMMVRFDDQTQGLEFAKKGEAAIINWEQRGSDKFATVIKPKLAKTS